MYAPISRHLQDRLDHITVFVLRILNKRVKGVTQAPLSNELECRPAHPIQDIDIP